MNTKNPKTASVLIIDDTPENLDVLRAHLEHEHFRVSVALNGEKALEITKKMIPDIILLDVMMSGIDGFETCRRLKQQPAIKEIPIIFITVLEKTEDKVKGLSVGGVDYITKPFQSEEVLARINTHLSLRRLQQELAQKNADLTKTNEKLKQEINRRAQAEEALQTASTKLSAISQLEAKRWGLSAFIGQSQAIKVVLDNIRRVQKVGKTSVVITGESGTGKELIARAIHFGGVRAKGPFIPVNCSAIPDELAESTFFGHVKGAFTGALSNHKGCFEQAQGGTLFLDEIGDMPLQLQAKILRLLEDGLVMPVGGTHSIQVDVRVVAATNADLKAKIAARLFRSDLYFRLAAYTITVPPLRERKEDIMLLVKHFLSLFTEEMGQKATVLSQAAQTALENYQFSGNVRELKNIIEHALISSGGTPIQRHHLHFLDEEMAQIPELESNAPDTKTAPIGDKENVLAYVREHGSINNSQCREMLDSNLRKASYLLKKMTEEKLLVRDGRRRWAIYRLP